MDENKRANDTNKIFSPAPFSTLEVDHEAIRQEQLRKEQKSALYPGAAEQGINVLPQVGANPEDFPEAIPPRGEDGGRSNTARSRICGMRKKTFWILLAIILLVVIGAAVGGGVGGSLASSDEDDAPDAANSSTTSTTASFLPNTNLAAVNFTQNSVEHHLVFFQTPSDGIYQSAWNSSEKTWAVSPVNLKDSTISRSELFKTPTPMSASYYACSSNVSLFCRGFPRFANTNSHNIDHQTPNLTLYFLDSSSRLRQLHTANPADSDWTTGFLDSTTNIPDATHLASYSCQHPSYPDYSDIWYQDSNGYYQIIDAFGRSKTRVDSTISSSQDVTVLKPPQNSSLAFVPHYIYDYNQTTKDPWLSVFFVNDDVLWEYHYKNNQMTFSSESFLHYHFIQSSYARVGWN